jgi:arylsulfatase A-like enzyme
LAEQTLIVYLSASGGALDWNSSDNFPLRGSKGSPWEGGWRVPFIMQWPGHLPKGLAYDHPVLSLDIFTTITALASAPVNPEVPLDGVNLVPFLTGQKTGAPHDSVCMRIAESGGHAVRSGEYKLIVPSTDKPAELYNLSQDISECNNLAATKPGVIQELVKKYADWRQAMTPAESSGKTSRPDRQ